MANSSISEKLQVLIQKTEEWSKKLEEAATTQNGMISQTNTLAESLQETLQAGIDAAQALVEQTTKASTAVTNASYPVAPGSPGFKGGSSGASNNDQPITVISKEGIISLLEKSVNNPYQAEINRLQSELIKQMPGYGKMITEGQKALQKQTEAKIDELAIKAEEWKQLATAPEKINKLMDSLSNITATMDAANKAFENSTDDIQASFYKQKIEDLKTKEKDIYAGIDFQKSLLSKYGQAIPEPTDRAADNAETYTAADLAKLVQEAYDKSGGAARGTDEITEINKILLNLRNAAPTKKYQLDLTVGDKALTSFTDVDPQDFLNALLKARGTAI